MLNAFRHQWKFHNTFHLQLTRWLCAQRLSASMEISQILFDQSAKEWECSTPFGINGNFTPPPFRAKWQRRECSTPFGINGNFTIIAICIFCNHSACSTPFGINGNFTQTISMSPTLPLVLNAFRHQWKFHHTHRCKPIRLHRVLNAFRHQWKFHKTRDLANTPHSTCSTPFGINGNFTGTSTAVTLPIQSAQRLSASMEISRYARCRRAQGSVCSTPFGINGNFTARDFHPMIAVCYKWLCGDR